MKQRIWFSLITVFLMGVFYGARQPKNETEDAIVFVIVWVGILAVNTFASYRKGDTHDPD